MTYDLIVIGGGAAGMTAAAVAAAEHQRVLLIESSNYIGGTTAISGGMVWIPANHKMAASGISDSLVDSNNYLNAVLPPDADRALRDAFLAHGDDMIRYLETKTAVRLRCVKRYPDYYPELPGATVGGRVLEPVPYDGNALGSQFRLLRPPMPEFTLFGGMMVSREDLPHFRKITQSPRSFWRVTKLVANYFMQRLHSPRGTTLYLGNALAARLYRSVLDLGVEIRLGVCVDRLTLEGGQLVGVETSSAQGRESLSATRGVILATGGISHDDGLRQRYVPLHAAPLSATVGAQGSSGASLALQVGARMREPHTSGAFWVPGSTFKRSDGTTGVYPHTVTDRAKPGLIAVDSTGKRFTNEAVSYHDFGLAQLNAPVNAIPAHLICDRRFLWKYGLGRIKPFSIKRKKYIDSGYLKCAPTLAGLGDHLGIPADNLESTVANFNAEAARGVDSVFGRGGNIYQRHMGDADHQPNPCVAALDAPPYYAVSVVPTDLGMAAGIITDSNARVINTAGDVIPGLYACGNDMDSLMAGAYPGPGITLGPALTFAFIAAKHAANR